MRAMPSSRRELQGPRPQPLKVDRDSWKVAKKPMGSISATSNERREPVIVYLDSPKIIHTRPQDFMSLVQQLTGKSSSSSSPCMASFDHMAPSGDDVKEASRADPVSESRQTRDVGGDGVVDPLLLTLGQYPPTPSSAPSPVSPNLFLCSPSTHQLLQEFNALH